jgi:hypothetical protein
MWPIVLGEAWVELPPGADATTLSEAGAIVTEGRRADGRIRILLDEPTADALEHQGFRLTERRTDHRLPVPLPGYHTPESGDALLDALAAASPRAGRVRIGTSTEGRPIEGIWLGQDPVSGARAVRVLGTHHGDEPTSYEVTLAFVERLATTDGTDPAVTSLLDSATVWVVPLVNPDGLVAGSRMSATGVDLNRNYDFEWSVMEPGAGPAPFSEPETRAIRAMGTWTRPYVALTLHAGAANLGWPWNYTTDLAPDALELQALAESYAGLCTMPGFWITQGADWYLSRGDTNDWAYGHHGTFDLTLEVSVEQTPPADALPVLAAQHLDAMIALLGTVPSVEGTVTDATTGWPIDAWLEVGGAAFRSDPWSGAYAQLAAPGADAHVEVTAFGYESATIETVGTGPATADVALEPVALGEGWVAPSVVREEQLVTIPGVGEGIVTLLHPSGPLSFVARRGTVLLDPATMTPGAWSVQRPDGTVLSRALWVDDPNGARIDAWSAETDQGVEITGEGFGAGARATAFVGATRRVVPIDVAFVSETTLQLATDDLPEDDRVDVAVWTNGSLLGIDDLWNARAIDDEDVPFEESGCGCTSTPSMLLLPLPACLLAFLPFARVRLRTRSRSGPVAS